MKKLLLVANVSKEHIKKFHIPFILRMKSLGWQVDIACRMDNPIPECDSCYDLPCDRNPFKGGLIKSIKILKKILKNNNFDVVHCNTVTGSIIARVAAKSFRKSGLKVIYTNHGMHFFKGATVGRWILGYPMEKILARYTDVLITINHTDYATAKKYLKACGKIELIHSIGVNLSRFREASKNTDRVSVIKKLGLEEKNCIITYVAEINSNKNQKALLKVFQIVKKAIPSSKLVLVGPDHTNGHFNLQVQNSGLADDILLLGWRDNIPKILSSSDIYAASSKSEGLSVNLIEAMACNIPVVAFKNRGHCEIINHGKNGFLADMNDYETMAGYIIELYNNKELYQKITEQAQTDICKYEINNVLSEIEQIYRENINQE